VSHEIQFWCEVKKSQGAFSPGSFRRNGAASRRKLVKNAGRRMPVYAAKTERVSTDYMVFFASIYETFG